MFNLHYKNSGTPAIRAGVLFLILLCSGKLSAQNSGVVQNDFEHSVKIFDQDGKTFVNPYVDVAGTPFFLEDWKTGRIKTLDNSVFTNIKLRLNLQSQEVHFLKTDKTEMVAPAAMIREIILFDSTSSQPATYTFQCGFPTIDNQTEKNFYLLLCTGRIGFLKAMRKTIHVDQDALSAEVHKEFREYEDYYFLIGGKLERMKRDKNSILGYMQDKKELVDGFQHKNNTSFKSPDDIKKLVDYYNSLF